MWAQVYELESVVNINHFKSCGTRYQGTVKILDKRYCYLCFFFFFFTFFFQWFFIGFWHGWFLNVYPTVMTTNLTTNSVTWLHRNETGCCCQVLQSLALAGLLTLLCYSNQTHCTPIASYFAHTPSVWWCCLPRISTGYCLLHYGSNPVLFLFGHPRHGTVQ